MSQNNYQRMFELIDEVFALKGDEEQLQVNDQQREKLSALHSATLSELANDAGPLIWCLIIPTTNDLMQAFVSGQINETQLLERTPLHQSYTAVYLCSVTTLPEARRQGNTFKLCLDAVNAIRNEHPIDHLFVWPFTQEGRALAFKLASKLQLPLLERKG